MKVKASVKKICEKYSPTRIGEVIEKNDRKSNDLWRIAIVFETKYSTVNAGITAAPARQRLKYRLGIFVCWIALRHLILRPVILKTSHW